MKRDLKLIVTKAVNRFNLFVVGDFENPKLYYTDKPYSGNDTFISEVTGNELMVENPMPGKRVYFIIKSDNSPDILSATRLIDLPEVDNFRDQGGYITEDGKTVKWGRFLRGAAFSELTGEGEAYLDAMGIKNIFDYRDVKEAALAPDYVPGGTVHNLVPAMRVNIGNDKADAKVAKTMEESMSEVTTNELYEEHIKGFHLLYEDLPFHNPAYEKLFAALDSEDTVPLYQHCSAGKDRTGVGCAMTLLALGVDKDTVMGDYLLSATYREETNKKFLEKIIAGGTEMNEHSTKLFHRLLSVEKGFLQASYDKIFGMYNDFETFLKEEYGVTPERLAHWRSIHLT